MNSVESNRTSSNINNAQAAMSLEEKLQSWSQGQSSLKGILEYSDDELYAIAHIGYYFLKQGKNQEAKTLFEGLVTIDPRNDYYYRALGVLSFKLDDPEKALRQFGYAIKVNDRNPVAYVNRAEVYIALGRYSEASQDLIEAGQRCGRSSPQLRSKIDALLQHARKKQ